MATVIVRDFHSAVRFQAGRFSPVVIGETERIRIVLACFEAGQFIPVHTPAVDLTLIVLEGDGTVVAGEDEVQVGPGAIVLVPAGETRGVRATSRMVAAHVVSPPPTEADHIQVQAGLQRGTWR
jgi:quercetin dioxygenase-like cupin family protein